MYCNDVAIMGRTRTVKRHYILSKMLGYSGYPTWMTKPALEPNFFFSSYTIRIANNSGKVILGKMHFMQTNHALYI